MYITYTIYGNSSFVGVHKNVLAENVKLTGSESTWIIPGTITQ